MERKVRTTTLQLHTSSNALSDATITLLGSAAPVYIIPFSLTSQLPSITVNTPTSLLPSYTPSSNSTAVMKIEVLPLVGTRISGHGIVALLSSPYAAWGRFNTTADESSKRLTLATVPGWLHRSGICGKRSGGDIELDIDSLGLFCYPGSQRSGEKRFSREVVFKCAKSPGFKDYERQNEDSQIRALEVWEYADGEMEREERKWRDFVVAVWVAAEWGKRSKGKASRREKDALRGLGILGR